MGVITFEFDFLRALEELHHYAKMYPMANLLFPVKHLEKATWQG